MTGTAAIHTMIDTHCSTESGPGGAGERRQIAGGVQAETVAQAIARAAALNSPRTCLIYPGIEDFDVDGVQALRDCFYGAARMAGAALGAGIGEPLTNKTLRLQGLESKLTDAEQTLLLQGGVVPLEFKENKGYRIVQSKTTWLGDTKYNNVELSTGMAADEVVFQVREALERQLVGQKNSPTLIAQAISITESVLIEMERNGIIVGDRTTGTPSYRNIQASASGDVVNVSFEMSPAIPANFILITAFAVPFSGQSAA
jgi:hypothetical protein